MISFSQKCLFPTGRSVIEFDLPDAEIIFIENFLPQEKSNELFESLRSEIQWQQDQINIFGKTHNLPRLTAWYGDEYISYSYSGIKMKPILWNDDLIFIKQEIKNYTKVDFNGCLLNYYRNGRDSMGWHQDNEKELGENPTIVSVSFGASRSFQLKHLYKKEIDKIDILLNHGSMLLMKGKTQHFWKHQVPKTNKILEPRINLTFRNIV